MRSVSESEKMGLHSFAVIFPTRNNSGQIRDHLIHAKSWIGLASEVIVVDSSTDDTLEICRSMLPAHTKIIQHPPGLYASWNAAIQSVESEFLYISTIGDTLDSGYLGRMLNYCSNHSLDMLISPPRFIGAKEGYMWPIHKFISEFSIREFVYFEAEDTVILNYWSLAKYGLSSLSGSFASNLVRTEILQQRPFSTKFGGFGDAMWFAAASEYIRLGLLPEAGSTFLIHPSVHQEFSHDYLHQCWQEAIGYQLKALAKAGRPVLNEKSNTYHACKMKLKKLRASAPGVFDFTIEKSLHSLQKKYLRLRLNFEMRKIERHITKLFSVR